MINTSAYINLNTRKLTSNIRNTAVNDKSEFHLMPHQLKEAEALKKVLEKPIKLASSTNFNRSANNINLAEGTQINTAEGYVLTVRPEGIEISGGNTNHSKASEAQNMAASLSALLRIAGGTMHTAAFSASEYQKWTNNVSKAMGYLGVDTSKAFTVNGVKFSKNESGCFEPETSAAAKTAYERLKSDSVYHEIAEITKKRIEYLSNYYLGEVPEEIVSAWNQILEGAEQ